MKKATETALRESIAKWQKNARIRKIENAKIRPDDCALCVLFFKKECRECPIAEHTAHGNCSYTPYSYAVESVDCCDVAAFRAAARDEVAFLQSLLPGDSQ